MNVIEAIHNRKSVRSFTSRPIDRETIEKILLAGGRAPSPLNRQPWKFVAVTADRKAELLDVIRSGIEKRRPVARQIKTYRPVLILAERSMEIMAEAPLTVFVLNPCNTFTLQSTFEEKVYEMMNVQSVGAAIQNMCLAAEELGLASLWICDMLISYTEICEWLGTESQLVAAVSFGYPAEDPPPRPRKPLDEIVEWR